jgi:hypothetical protein
MSEGTSREGRRRRPPLFRQGFRQRYGAHPAHLLLLVAAAAVAGWAVLQWLQAPTPVRLLVWFGAAVIGHDLVAFPIYSGLDHLLIRVIGGTSASDESATITRWRRAAINHIRFPALLSGLLLLMWYPLILKRSNGVYFAASGQRQSRYLGNYLLAVALLFGGSLVIFLLRLARAAGRSRNDASPPGTTPPATTETPSGHEKNQP